MLRRVPLTVKVSALVALAVGLMAAALWAAASRELRRELEAKQRMDSERQLHSLALLFASRVPGAKVTVEHGRVTRVEAPSLADLADLSIVDDAASTFGGTATIFALDPDSGRFIRRVTTVKKETGERAVGTALASNSPAQQPVRRGEAYHGPTVLFGQRLHAAYHPTVDDAGEVNGLLYVGTPLAPYVDAYRRTMDGLTLAAGLTAVLACLGAGIAAGGLFQPLKAVVRRADALARGHLDETVRHQGRGDEIGAIARALENIRVAAARLGPEPGAPWTEESRARDLDAAIRAFREGAAELLESRTAASPDGMPSSDRPLLEPTLARLGDAAESMAQVTAAAEALRALVDRSPDPSWSGQEARRADGNDVVDLIRTVAEQANRFGLTLAREAARGSRSEPGREAGSAIGPNPVDPSAPLRRTV